MKVATIVMFGSPIPTVLLPLAHAIDRAIIEAEQSIDKKLRLYAEAEYQRGLEEGSSCQA
ncbi:unnamed protein product, partial [marine sediment metagenome]